MKTNKILGIVVAGLVALGGLTSGAQAADAPAKTKIKICGGPPGLSYEKIAGDLADQLKAKFFVEVIATAGGAENVKKVRAGECDAGIAPDFIAAGNGVTISTELFDSYGILLCNADILKQTNKDKPGISTLFNRRDLIVATGVKGSTASETWRLLATTNKKFAAIQTADVDFKTALTDVLDKSIGCAWAASGRNADLLKAVNTPEASKLVTLVAMDNGDFDDAKAGGKEVIKFATLTSKEFPQLLPSGWVFDRSLETITFKTSIILNSSLMVRDPRANATLSQIAANLGKQK